MRVETPRLVLRRVTPDDLPDITRLNADPEVMRHITAPFTPAQTRAWVVDILASYSHGRLGWLVAERRDSGVGIGLAAIKKLSPLNLEALGQRVAGRPDNELVEIGWRFHREHWGHGYATETGRALLAFGFGELRLPRVLAVALVANVGSCTAIGKCGLQPVADYTVTGRPARLFALDRAAYEAAEAAGA